MQSSSESGVQGVQIIFAHPSHRCSLAIQTPPAASRTASGRSLVGARYIRCKRHPSPPSSTRSELKREIRQSRRRGKEVPATMDSVTPRNFKTMAAATGTFNPLVACSSHARPTRICCSNEGVTSDRDAFFVFHAPSLPGNQQRAKRALLCCLHCCNFSHHFLNAPAISAVELFIVVE